MNKKNEKVVKKVDNQNSKLESKKSSTFKKRRK